MWVADLEDRIEGQISDGLFVKADEGLDPEVQHVDPTNSISWCQRSEAGL